MATAPDAAVPGPIVVGVDGSAYADRAVLWASDAAARHHTPLVALHAWAPPALDLGVDFVTLEPVPYEAFARELLDDAVQRAVAAGAPVTPEPQLVRDRATAALVDASSRAFVLVVGAHGRGWLAEHLLGSVALQSAAHAHCPVVVVPEEWADNRHGCVVVGVDGSEPSYAALRFAAREAASRGAALEVVNVWPAPEPVGAFTWDVAAATAAIEQASRDLAELMARSIAPDPTGRTGPRAVEAIAAEGSAGPVLAEMAGHADLLVVGSRGRGGLSGLLLGSVSRRSIHLAPCPVAVVRAPS